MGRGAWCACSWEVSRSHRIPRYGTQTLEPECLGFNLAATNVCVYYLVRSVGTNHRKLGALTNRNGLCQSSGGWKSQTNALAGQFFLRAGREHVFRTSLPASGCLPAICGILCVCLCPDCPFLSGYWSWGSRVHPLQDDFILTDSVCNDPIFK